MKKFLLCLGAIMLSALSYAQTSRQYMGAYISDDHSAEGLGLKSYPGTYSIIADIPAEQLKAYDGGKVTGMRFAVAEPAQTTKCFVLKYSQNKEDTLAVARISNSKAGWNEVTFDTPAILDLTGLEGICIGYDYVQTSENRPISYTEDGNICETYIYGDLGEGTGYYNIGLSNYGNLCVQAIVEKNYTKYNVDASEYEDVYALEGKTGEAEMTVYNLGTEHITNLSYTVSKNGITSAEKQLDLTSAISPLIGFQTVSIPLDAAQQACEEQITITLTKVNGQPNQSANKVAEGKLMTVKKLFTHRVAVEEFTGTGCGYCPRGMQGMENLRETFGDNFIGIALHQYNSSDAMYISPSNYKQIGFNSAPSCMLERNGETLDPYYGSYADIRDDFQKALAKVALAGVEVKGMWSEDQKKVVAKATVESMTNDKTYNIEYVLVGDNLSGLTTAWKQSNYYYQQAATSQPADLAKYCSGGTYGKNGFFPKFNDVALASSYVGGKNQAESLGQLKAYVPTESVYTISMPTNSTLLKAVKYDQVYIIALVVDKETGKIVNAAKSSIDAYDATGITDVNDDVNGGVSETKGTFNLAGQRVNGNYKGIIIKNGRKYIR